MRALCCLDGTNLGSLTRAIEFLPANQEIEVGLLYVIDLGPRHDIEQTRQRFFRPHGGHAPRGAEMSQAERDACAKILEEGLRVFPGAEVFQREGKPEREIVAAAAEWKADLILICPRALYSTAPGSGPKSIGHVARFVIDHAPCSVLLIRVTG